MPPQGDDSVTFTVALIKHRPKLSLRAPGLVVSGTTVGTVIVDVRREVPIEAITVDLRGEERVTIGTGEGAHVYRRMILRGRAELSGPRVLPVGRQELQFSFVLPDDAPPTCALGRGVVEYLAKVRVDIDWWPDVVETFFLRVGAAAPLEPKPSQPRLYRTAPEGAAANQQALEVSLVSDVVALGGNLDLAIALANTGASKTIAVRVAFRPVEKRFDGQGRLRQTADLSGFVFGVPMEHVVNGTPFSIAVPEVPPSFRGQLFHLEWILEVEGVVPWGPNLKMRVPLEITPRGGVSRPEGLSPALVGSPRQRAIWEETAAREGFAFDGSEMTTRVGDCAIRVRAGGQGAEAGVALLAEVSYPSLQLGLDGGEKGSFHRLLKKSTDLDDPRMSERHYIAGRDDDQVRAFVGALGESFFTTQLDDIDDHSVKLVAGDASPEALAGLCRAARAFGEAVGPARAAIPPPNALAPWLAAWEAVATGEGASLERARMALHFLRGDDRSAVITEWTGEGVPFRTTVLVAVASPVDAEYHFASVAVALGETEALDYGADARRLLSRLVEETPHVRVEANVLVAHLEPQLEDPSAAVVVLRRLEALHALLRGATGPYR